MKRHFVIAIFMIAASGVGQAQTFRKTKMVDGAGKEVLVELGFDKPTQLLTVKALATPIAEVPYANIEKLSYERASRRRVKEGAIVMLASLGAGGIVMLTKSKNHWLYVDYKDAGTAKALTLKLDKSEYTRVLETAAGQTGKQVETLMRDGQSVAGKGRR